MKKTKKFLAFLLAMIMVLAMGMTTMAAGTGTITITPPAGTDANATNTYKIYKVFDAVGDGNVVEGKISYKLVEGKTDAPAGFSVDDAGNVTLTRTTGDLKQLTADEIAAIAGYVTESDLVATVKTTGAAAAISDALPNGYYYITTSTGTVVTINSTNPNATVTDKNTVPTLDKKIDEASSVDEDGKKALAEIGSAVVYEATITVGNGAKGYVFYDKMSDGLSLSSDPKAWLPNGDPFPYINVEYNKIVNETQYTFVATFKEEAYAKLKEGDIIIIRYSATINDNALTLDPENNTAYLSYGDENSNNRTPDSETEVYNAKFTVTKKDGEGDPLAGAGFVVKNADGKYYKLANTDITWVDSINDATEYTSDADGNVEPFTGLANGTYTLVEKTVPAGYNKAEDKQFTIAEHIYTAENLEQTAEVTNNAGALLPSTGGIGTTMFYVIGGALVVCAAVLLVTRKRMSVEK